METKIFMLARDYIELCSLLKIAGVANSGGEAKAYITEGQIRVDGVVETRKRCKIKAGQEVQCNNLKILIKSGEE